MKHFITLLAIITLFSYAKCKKDIHSVESLPPATQEGKNTLGFMLNGEAWTPKGIIGLTSNLSLYYDETYRGGSFNIHTYNADNSGRKQRITLMGEGIQSTQRILLPNPNKFGIIYNDNKSTCEYNSTDASVTVSGYFDIQKLDKVNRIFSGVFELTINKSGCESIVLSNGRFDMKY